MDKIGVLDFGCISSDEFAALVAELDHVKLELDHESRTLRAFFHGFWSTVSDAQGLQKLRNYNTFRESNDNPEFVEKHKGQYLLVMRTDVLFVSRSKNAALLAMIDNHDDRDSDSGIDALAYLGIVGLDADDPSNFMCMTQAPDYWKVAHVNVIPPSSSGNEDQPSRCIVMAL